MCLEVHFDIRHPLSQTSKITFSKTTKKGKKQVESCIGKEVTMGENYTESNFGTFIKDRLN